MESAVGEAVQDVEVGLSLPNRGVLFGLSPQTLLDAADVAEQSGAFGSVWVGDNFLSKPRLEAIVTLAGIAARTKRLKLGTICLATFPMRHPLPLAIQWASLDVLSGGRTILAVCNGGSAKDGPGFALELETMGVASKERVGRLEEGIQILRRFWSGEPVDHAGKYYSFRGVQVQPRPVQTEIPIVIAVNPHPSQGEEVEERILRRVARLADGWQTDGLPPELFRKRWNRIRQMAQEEGRGSDVNHVSLHLMVNINDDAAAARRAAVEFLNHYYGVGTISEEKLSSWLAFGSPAAVVEKIEEFIEAGCTTPVLRFVDADQIGQMGRCIDEVIPHLSKTTSVS
jgi:alkanesulfonate monooxygenase SsuD/methylene tetrahydromethanopterin reductase-like flavin-dependent oxidoreductase (luciferase family)